jgi:TPR repeat protein
MRKERIYSQAKAILYKIHDAPPHSKARASEYEKYIKLIRKAAHLGHWKAQWVLGLHYDKYDFDSLKIDNKRYNPKKCVYWYGKACDQKHSDACNNLAIKYENGEGCEQDIKKALELYKKAADLKNSLGKKNYKALLKDIELEKYKLI